MSYRGLLKLTAEEDYIKLTCSKCSEVFERQDYGDGIDIANLKPFIDRHIRTCNMRKGVANENPTDVD